MDEQMREKFEAKYPMPSQCIWAGSGYAPTDYNAWNAQKHCARWEGWQACAAALSQPAATQWDLRVALGFYADLERYNGPNQRVVRDRDPFTPEDAVYVQDVTRDRGQIARDALAGIAP